MTTDASTICTPIELKTTRQLNGQTVIALAVVHDAMDDHMNTICPNSGDGIASKESARDGLMIKQQSQIHISDATDSIKRCGISGVSHEHPYFPVSLSRTTFVFLVN